MLKNQSKVILICIVGLALVLRLGGITNGFPYIFHPDEPTIVRSALGIRFFPNPGHFDWPHLYVYINYLFYMGVAKLRDLAALYGFKTVISQYIPIIWNDNLIFYLITRVLSAFLAGLTTIPVYLTGKKVFGEKAGLLAALTFTLIPFHIRHAHYSLPDAPMVFLLAWSVYFSSGILLSQDSLNYSGAGFYSGLAASTKYNGGLGFITVPLAHLMRLIKNREELLNFDSFMNMLVAVVLLGIGFLIGTPYAALDYKTFLRTDGPAGALWQFTNVGSVTMYERPARFILEMTGRIADDLGYVFLGIFFFVVLLLILKKLLHKSTSFDYFAWFYIITGTVLLLYVSGFSRPRSHYYMIVYPFVAIIVGYFCSQIFDFIENKVKLVPFVVFALIFVIPLYYSVEVTYTFSNPDTRNVLSQWLYNNVKSTDSLVYTNSALGSILDPYGYETLDGIENVSKVQQGYAVVSYDTLSAAERFSLLQHIGSLKEVYSISNQHKNGPNIKVFAINK